MAQFTSGGKTERGALRVSCFVLGFSYDINELKKIFFKLFKRKKVTTRVRCCFDILSDEKKKKQSDATGVHVIDFFRNILSFIAD